MSEESPKKIFQVEVYKEKTTISIDLPVEYVVKFNELLTQFIPFKDEKHFFETMKNITDKKFDDPFAYHCATILSFLVLVEESAREQGKIEKVEFNSETKEVKKLDE